MAIEKGQIQEMFIKIFLMMAPGLEPPDSLILYLQPLLLFGLDRGEVASF